MTNLDDHPECGQVPKVLLTPEEAAHALGVGRTKVYELLKEGSLRSVMIGGSRRIPMTGLMELVAGLTQTSSDSIR